MFIKKCVPISDITNITECNYYSLYKMSSWVHHTLSRQRYRLKVVCVQQHLWEWWTILKWILER
jgi:hypothetical protein